MAEAFVTPHLWTWARQRRGLEVEDLAKKLNVKPLKWIRWSRISPPLTPTGLAKLLL